MRGARQLEMSQPILSDFGNAMVVYCSHGKIQVSEIQLKKRNRSRRTRAQIIPRHQQPLVSPPSNYRVLHNNMQVRVAKLVFGCVVL